MTETDLMHEIEIASNLWLAMEQALKILTTNLPDIKKRFADAIDFQAVTQAHLSEMLRDLKFCRHPKKLRSRKIRQGGTVSGNP